MLSHTIWIILVIFNTLWASSNGAQRLPAVDALISSLQQERWGDDERCLQATLLWLSALQNNTLWAAWMWDSMHPPRGTLIGNSVHLGNFDQCLQFPWAVSHPNLRPQYCIVDVHSYTRHDRKDLDAFDDAHELYLMPSKYARYNIKQEIGVCLPAACDPGSVSIVTSLMLRHTLLPAGDVKAHHSDCYIAGKSQEITMKFYAFWVIIGTLVTIAVLSTTYHRSTRRILRDDKKVETYSRSSCLNLISGSFCIKRNYSDLFKTSQDDILSMNGVRTLSAIMIAIAHDALYSMQTPSGHTLALDKMAMSWDGKIILQTALQVDTFFTMSGLLLMWSLVRGNRNLIIVLVKRFFRLLGPFVITMLYVGLATMEMDSSPYWKRANRYEVEACEKYWWKSLLMMNTHVETVCHPPTWYIAGDYQLTVVSISLFYIYKKSRRMGAVIVGVLAAGMSLYLGYDVYRKRFPYLSFHYASILRFREYTSLMYHYMSFYCHSGAYSVGATMGYVMAQYAPKDHRYIINKKWSTILLMITMSAIMVALLLGALLQGVNNQLLISVLVPGTKIMWAAAICCIIATCEYGSAPILNSVLSWSGFVPLSKLTFSMYLTHTLFIQKDKLPARILGVYSHYLALRNGIGVVVLSFATSLILYLIIEAPLINLVGYKSE